MLDRRILLVALLCMGCDDDSSTSELVGDAGADALADASPEPDRGLDAERLRDAAIDSALELDLGADVEEVDAETPLDAELPRLASFRFRAGVEIVTVTEAEPGVPLTLYDAEGEALVTIITDELGQAHFAYVPHEHLVLQSGPGAQIPVRHGTTLSKGEGYVISNDSVEPPDRTRPFRVLGVHDVPHPRLYRGQDLEGIVVPLITDPPEDQDVNEGLNYITMRDGVQLSAMVRFPDPLFYGPGPYPTVIEYSGYSPSRPDSVAPGMRIAGSLGFATVGVNMRGTGCSGGVFDVFNPAQHADGYDVVEAVARNAWVLGNRVGMVGLSYSGIAQLFVARTNPPSLAAVAPLSVIADPWQQQWPGGVYNAGFTKSWLEQRDSDAASHGQNWTSRRIEWGDETCEANQRLRLQNIDFEQFLRLLEFFNDAAADRSLMELVREIEMPVFLAGAFQDEQTGAQFAGMLDHFDAASTAKFTLYNGRHPDGYSTLVLSRWFEFLSFYVTRAVPRLHLAVRAAAGEQFSDEFGVSGLDFEADRFLDFADDDYEGALAAYEAEDPVRVLFESGGHPDYEPGAPIQRFEASFDTFPPREMQGRSLYLGAEGALLEEADPGPGTDVYAHDPYAGDEDFFGRRGYQLLAPLWSIDWTDYAEGAQLSYLSAPFAEDAVLLGPSYVELWFASEAEDVNIQVTLSEINGERETYVSGGWLRAGHRAEDPDRSDEFRVVHPFTEEAFVPLTPGEPARLRVAIPPVAHAFRAGTRLRLTIATPGRNHGTWTFENPAYEGATVHSVLRGGATPSRLYLPFVEGIEVAPGAPLCPGLRGQPCRDYTPVANTPGE